MRRSLTILAVLSFVVLQISLASTVWAQADAINQFGFDMYDELRRTPGNLIFSPLSLSAALAMTYAGAAGTTADEMAAVLHLDPNDARVHEKYGALLRALGSGAGDDSYQLDIANRLWGQRGYEFLDSFLGVTRDHYGAALEQVDFGNSERAARTINDWIGKQTAGRITDLIARESINSLVRLILTNAVYFKGRWANPFEIKNTRTELFHLDRTTTRDVQMMKRGGSYSIAEDEGLSILQLTYAGGGVAMLILLPDSVDGLARVEEQLSSAKIDAWVVSLRTEDVRAEIPRFRATSMFILNEPLAARGMSTAFGQRAADFSAMSGQRDLFISLVAQEAFVDVGEVGTEAAAASAVWAQREAGMYREQLVFRADHPFVFLIRDEKSGAILFLGRLVDPV